jgi:transcriptional regulator with XRE-family HTH domain
MNGISVERQIYDRAKHRCDLPPAEERKRLRRSLRMSQRELADIIGCHQVTVSEWERGLKEPSETYLVRYLEALNAMAKATGR